MARVRAKLFGIVPPTTTAFGPDGEIDEAGIRAQIGFLLGAGVHGLAATARATPSAGQGRSTI